MVQYVYGKKFVPSLSRFQKKNQNNNNNNNNNNSDLYIKIMRPYTSTPHE